MEQIVIVNGTEIIKFKAKDFGIVTTPLCLGNISKDFSVDNVKKTELNGNVYDFSVDYDDISVDDILDRHSQVFNEKEWYNMKCLGLLKNVFFFTVVTFLAVVC